MSIEHKCILLILLYKTPKKEDHVLTNSEGTTLKKVKDFNYLGSFIGSTAHDIDVRIAKAWGQ